MCGENNTMWIDKRCMCYRLGEAEKEDRNRDRRNVSTEKVVGFKLYENEMYDRSG